MIHFTYISWEIVNDIKASYHNCSRVPPQIARFMGPTWDPHGSCRPQMGPMLAPWTLLSGLLWVMKEHQNPTMATILFNAAKYICAILRNKGWRLVINPCITCFDCNLSGQLLMYMHHGTHSITQSQGTERKQRPISSSAHVKNFPDYLHPWLTATESRSRFISIP